MAGLVHPWKLGIDAWNPDMVQQFESILALGNGRIGQRANFEEGFSGKTLQGSYLAGIYYPDKTRVGWWKNGYPEFFAKVLNSTNWIGVDVFVNGEKLDLQLATSVKSFSWGLDMREGILTRSFQAVMPNGKEVSVHSERFCSMDNPDLGCIRFEVEAPGCDVKMTAYLDADVKNEDSNWDDQFWKILGVNPSTSHVPTVSAKTMKTDFGAAFAMSTETTLYGDHGAELKVPSSDVDSKGGRVWQSFTASLGEGERLSLKKFVGIATTLHHEEARLTDAAVMQSESGRQKGWNALVDNHREAWAQIWKQADIEIEGDEASQQAIRFNIFHLNQTYRGDDSRLNIGPKGFTGEKYGGASYWDTEAYCLPFFLAGHDQNVARQLLLYRYNHLEKAIENAQKLGFSDGAALYPMVTMNGEECHNEWEITFEEIHRNGAMSYAIWNYVNYTGDTDYLRTHGFPVLVGVARFWEQRVQWSEFRKAYVMLGVTGPNEYENNVNNNWYTNYIAAWCMRYAREVAIQLKNDHPDDWSHWVSRLSLEDDQVFNRWSSIPDQIVLPRLEGTRIWLQQDGFMDKEQLNARDLPSSQRPINQHWSWDRILRSVFIKQADVLQGMYFFWNDFDIETHRDNYDFYEPKTVHESSLSPCVHAILAVRLGKMEDAYSHYLRTSRLDLDDYNKEVHEGLHITSMAGTWLSVVEGFGGFRVEDGMPCFNAKLPERWSSLRFKLHFRGRLIEVFVNQGNTAVRRLEGAPLEINVNGQVTAL